MSKLRERIGEEGFLYLASLLVVAAAILLYVL
jgi:hypothetical protein